MSDIRNTVLLILNLDSFGTTRRVPVTKVEVDADKALIGVNMHLLQSPQLKAIKSLDGEIRTWLKTMCLPFEAGINLLPIDAIETVDAKLQEFSLQRAALVEELVAVSEALQDEDARRLNGVYDHRHRVTPDELRDAYSMSYKLLSFETPDSLRRINTSIFEREREKMSAKFEQAYDEARTILRETCRDLVGHLREKLEADANGKRKRLHETTLTGLQEFLANFSVRNITDDAELTRIVEQAKAVLEGRNVEALRDFDAVRSQVHQDLSAIEADIDRHLIQPAHRRLSLVDDFGSAA